MIISEKTKNVGEFFKDLTGFIDVLEYYKKIEKKLEKEGDEEFAINLGFVPDNYYTTAKAMMDHDNTLHMHINVSARGSLNRTSRC